LNYFPIHHFPTQMNQDKIRILYVEDEPFLARVVKESMESRGFEVNLVSDGALALQEFLSYQPNICVLDVMLPTKDGFSIAREIKQVDERIPVIFLTAKTQTKDLLEGFDAGGNDYLKKPFSMEELIIRIHNLLKLTSAKSLPEQKEKTAEEIPIGQYRFLPRQFELRINGDVRKLSLRETRLLALLTQDINNPVMRQDILMEIWGDDSFYNSRNLDVYISRMRDYLSADPAIQIVTLKGIGYRVQVQTNR
jgi:DNA-binding response OmpR family regulator